MLEIRSIDAFYGDSHIIHSVSFSVAEGEGVAVLGRNGAGKSTILKSIMNAGPTVSGEILFDGIALGRKPFFQRARLGLGLVPEDRRIYPHLSVLENIAMAKHAVRQGTSPYEPMEIINRFSMLSGLEKRFGYQLSGGQQQLLAVARTLLARPRCVLLDEPTEGLAPVIVEWLAEDIRTLREKDHMSLLLTEQNIWFSRQCTERCIVIDSGKAVFSGTWAEFDERTEIRDRYLAL